MHIVVIIFQATIVFVTILVVARVFQPLPCFVVSLFSGSWKFALLLLMGYWNCISFVQLCIILQWTFILEWEGKKILGFSSSYAFLFAAIGLASDVILVCFIKQKLADKLIILVSQFKFHDKVKDESAVLQSGSLSNFLVDNLDDDSGMIYEYKVIFQSNFK